MVAANSFFCPCVSCKWVVAFGAWIRFRFEMYTHTHTTHTHLCVFQGRGWWSIFLAVAACSVRQQVGKARGVSLSCSVGLMAVNNHFLDHDFTWGLQKL